MVFDSCRVWAIESAQSESYYMTKQNYKFGDCWKVQFSSLIFLIVLNILFVLFFVKQYFSNILLYSHSIDKISWNLQFWMTEFIFYTPSSRVSKVQTSFSVHFYSPTHKKILCYCLKKTMLVTSFFLRVWNIFFESIKLVEGRSLLAG